MSYEHSQDAPLPISEAKVAEVFTAAMQRVYLWMSLGLLLTAAVAWMVINTPIMFRLVFSSQLTFFGLIVIELILVVVIGRAMGRLSPATALSLFFVYAAVNGLTLSVIFLVYALGTITLAFSVTAALFGIMSLIGFITKEDLSNWGGFLFMGLIGLLLASLANLLLANSTLDWIITYAGILIFLGLTVYDTQRIKKMTYAAVSAGQDQAVGHIGVLGALHLYLDFINLFLFILRLLGRRR